MIHQLILFKFCNKVILETENVKIGIDQDNAGVMAKIVLDICAMEIVIGTRLKHDLKTKTGWHLD